MRNGKIYKTVTIGAKRWMAENLNVKTKGSWCYENKESYCKKYGRLYTWDAAKKACPRGWHLSSRGEWDSLVTVVGGKDIAGKKLKAKSGWDWNDDDDKSGNGADDYGFSALPGGYRYSDGYFNYAGYDGYWWTATEDGASYAYGRSMDYNGDHVHEYDYDVNDGISVRCVGD
jgi:uncharacterized protein (TIGR02145 family)